MRSVLVLVMLCAFGCIGLAQPITVTNAATTPSVCYNDGSFTLTVTGGTPPYTYLIISGPQLPNVTYPIQPDVGSTFLSLHSGTYTVRITDNAGQSITYNVVVPGNYQYPVGSATVSNDSIIAAGSLGKPPYTYALSSTGPNGPFGAYQSSNIFAGICSGTFYLRVKDSCGNFFTTTAITVSHVPLDVTGRCTPGTPNNIITATVTAGTGVPPYRFTIRNGNFTANNTTGVFTHAASLTCPDTIYAFDFCNSADTVIVDCNPISLNFCSSFSDSTATVTVTGGTPPYTYRFNEFIGGSWQTKITQASPNFTGLQYASMGNNVAFQAVDGCGRVANASNANNDAYMRLTFTAKCPFDSILYLTGAIGAYAPITLECLNCIPAKTPVTYTGGALPFTVFAQMDTGRFSIRATDACGETRVFTVEIPTGGLSLQKRFTACNDVTITALSGSTPVTSGVTYTIYIRNSNNTFDSLYRNTTGLFQNLAPGHYKVMAFYYGCKESNIEFDAPEFSGYCTFPYFDTLCNLRIWMFNYVDDAEKYSLIGPPGNTTYVEAPPGANDGADFFIPPGTYQMVSDSGCSTTRNFNYSFRLQASDTINCSNRASLRLSTLNTNFNLPCNPPTLRYILAGPDTTLFASALYNTSVTFNNLDTGIYKAYVYFSDSVLTTFSGQLRTGNVNCPIDSITIEIGGYTLPVLSARNSNVCGAAGRANVPFTILGGLGPFTVTIAGQSTVTVNTRNGNLPNVPIGSYTMIVSDGCGISSSFSVSVVDSCAGCAAVKADFTADTLVCAGQTVSFQNVYTGASTYRWTDNGTQFSTTVNPTRTLTALGNHVIQCIVTTANCTDTFSLTIRVVSSLQFSLGADTAYCNAFSRVLSAGSSAVWSTGVTAASITVTAPGRYWATINSPCGVFTDTIQISQTIIPASSIGNDTAVCTGSTVVSYVQLDSAVSNITYAWLNNGSLTGITVDSFSLQAQNASAYNLQVVVTYLGCTDTLSRNIQSETITNFSLGADTTYCGNFTHTFTIASGNVVWSTGATTLQIQVSEPGLYWGQVTNSCGTVRDTVILSQADVPEVNIGNDTAICDGDTVWLDAGAGDLSYQWSTEQTTQTILVNTEGTYSVTVSNGICDGVDGIIITLVDESPFVLPGDTTLCLADEITLSPSYGTNPVWSDGSQAQTYRVTVAGVYGVTVDGICGQLTDSIFVEYEQCGCYLKVPNAFTPNADGHNDVFAIVYECPPITEFTMRIYNRWGARVFETNTFGAWWNGIFNNTPQPAGTFIWYVQYTDPTNAQVNSLRGSVTLLR